MHPARIVELLGPFLDPANDRSQPALTGAKGLTAHDLELISTYIDLLQRWNARINLTAIRDEDQIVTRHFGESLFAAAHLFPNRKRASHPFGSSMPVQPSNVLDKPGGAALQGRVPLQEKNRASVPEVVDANDGEGGHSVRQHNRGRAALLGPRHEDLQHRALAPGIAESETHPAAERQQIAAHGASRGSPAPESQAAEQRKQIILADLGSGAGFPGIPIKLWAPDISLTLIESNQKKATFLKELTRILTLTNVNIQTARAESLPPSTFDVVTLRAVERFESILPAAARLLASDARLALLIGSAQLPIAQSTLPTLKWSLPLPLPGSKSRVLALASARS